MYKMNDGRHFTNYDSSESMNSRIKIQNNISNNEDYRSFMTKNALNVMKTNASNYETHSYEYTPKKEFINHLSIGQSTNTPYMFSSVNDKSEPTGYETNPTKDLYLSMQQIKQYQKNKYSSLPKM